MKRTAERTLERGAGPGMDAGEGRDARPAARRWVSTVSVGDVLELVVDGRTVRVAVEPATGRRVRLAVSADDLAITKRRATA